MILFEPVAAIATSTATDAALSVIRMTGKSCREILSRCIRKDGRGIDLETADDRFLILCEFWDAAGAGRIDIVTVIVYRGPKSYTGEDMAELICHGGRGITKHIFSKLLEAGFSAAQCGDFTRRAFLNGKLDLAQAESVSAATMAASGAAARAAASGMAGETSDRVKQMSDRLVDVLSLLEANLDLSEDGIDVVEPDKIKEALRQTASTLDELLTHAARADSLSGAVRVVLIGKPNVGKSTILNRLLGSDRAIVSAEPGTTRDVVDGRIDMGDMTFEFLDTAGVRTTDSDIESEGVDRARRAAMSAHVVAHVLDAGSIGPEDIEIGKSIAYGPARILVVNKTDLAKPAAHDLAPLRSNGFSGANVVETVGTRPEGVDSLRAALIDFGVSIIGGLGDAPVWIGARQAECLRRAQIAVDRAMDAAQIGGLTEEFLSADIREALDALAEFGGRKTSDDTLNRIFASFCVGK